MTRLAINSDAYARVAEWLYEEALLLDRGQFADWLGLLDPAIKYRMPVRQALLPKQGTGYDPEFGFFEENYASLKTRIDRLATDQAWADQPMSRTRHLVNNVLVEQAEGGFAVTSAFMLTRIRLDLPYDLFTGERQDLLVDGPDGLKLANRLVLIDQTIIKSNNLSMLF